MESQPQVVDVAQGVRRGQLHDDALPGVVGEPESELPEVVNVVEDVVAHHHVGRGRSGRGLWPRSLDGCGPHAGFAGLLAEGVEHSGRRVHADQKLGLGDQGQRRTPGAASDIEHATAFR